MDVAGKHVPAGRIRCQSAAPGQIIGRREHPGTGLRIVEEGKIIRMVIAVMGEDIEAHPPVHLNDLFMAPGHCPDEPQESVIVKAGKVV